MFVWKRSFQDGGPAATSKPHLPRKAVWVSISVSLLLVVAAVSLTGHLGALRIPSQVSAHPTRRPRTRHVTAHQSRAEPERALPLDLAGRSDHGLGPGRRSRQPVGRGGPGERPGDLLSGLDAQRDVRGDLRRQTRACGLVRPGGCELLVMGCAVAGFDMLQARGAGLLLPAAHGPGRPRKRALPPPPAAAGNQRQHTHRTSRRDEQLGQV